MVCLTGCFRNIDSGDIELEDSRGQGFEGSSEVLKNYKDLKVWQKSFKLCLEIYRLTSQFPHEEKYGLTSQIKRSAVSIP